MKSILETYIIEQQLNPIKKKEIIQTINNINTPKDI